MIDNLVCWKCGVALDELPQPLARLAECPACRTDLHVCRLCRFYDTRAAKSCRETIAEEVKDKDRANFCEYFQERANAYTPRSDDGVAAARDQLDAMFGGAPSSPAKPDAARSALDDLFSDIKPDG
jgi:hypothetical protein